MFVTWFGCLISSGLRNEKGVQKHRQQGHEAIRAETSAGVGVGTEVR